MIRDLIYNEEQKSKVLYEQGFSNGFSFGECLLVAKHLRHTLGLGNAAIRTRLKEYIPVYDKNFSYRRSRKTVGKIISLSQHDFRKTGSVAITQAELEFIRTIRNFKYQKIAVGLLFIAKRLTNAGYVNKRDWRDIRRLISAKITNSDIQDTLKHLNAMGDKIRITNSYRSDPAYQMLFINDGGEAVFTLDNDASARKLGQMYVKWCGGELIWCKSCGRETVKKSNRQYMCDECWNKRQREMSRNSMRKLRNNVKG